MNPAWEHVDKENSPEDSQRLARAERRAVAGAADGGSYMEMVAGRENHSLGLWTLEMGPNWEDLLMPCKGF